MGVTVLLTLLFLYGIVADEYGHCKLVGNQNNPLINGYVYLHTKGDKVTVTVNITGSAHDDHGIHIHEFGDLSSPLSDSAGGHYKGYGNGTHGCPSNPARDSGDMGNWDNYNGVIFMNKTLDLIDLTGNLSVIGRAVVVHIQQDDCSSVASAGKRVAHCVIGVGNPLYAPPFLGINQTNIANNEGTAVGILATCELSGINISGRIVFEQLNSSVRVTARVSGLDKNSTHGFHIHDYGDLGTLDGMALGTHYNPYNVTHALPPTSIRHLGDLGNICTFGPDGVAYYNSEIDNINVNGLHNIIGRGFVIHSIRDDGGKNYGVRIATCVIGVANKQFTAPYVFDESFDPICETPRSYFPSTTGTTNTGGVTSSSAGTSSTTGSVPAQSTTAATLSTSGSTSLVTSASITSSTSSSSSKNQSPSSNKGAKIAVGILIPLFVINLFVVGVWLYLRKKKQMQDDRYQPFLDE